MESQEIHNLIVKVRKEKIGEIILKTKKTQSHSLESLKTEHRDIIKVVDIGFDNDGLFTMAEGHKYKNRGFLDGETSSIVTIYKKLFYLIAENFKNVGLLKKIIIAFSLYFQKDILPVWFERMFTTGYFLLKDEYWQKPVKEIKRVLTNYLPVSIVNAIIMILEYDNAYKYRVQDILPELNKNKLIGYFSTRNEVLRLCDLYISRESLCYQGKMSAIRKLVSIAIFFPKLNKMIRDILKEIDIEKIKFDKIDLYWVRQRPVEDYKFNI